MQNNDKKDLASFLSHIEDASLPEAKAVIAQKMGSYYSQGIFQGEEIELAYSILAILAKDAEVMVRKSLAKAFKDDPKAPHGIMLTLAHDVAEVAEIVLEFSKALTSADLIAVIEETQEIIKFIAIAKRDQLPESIIGALWKKRQDQVIIHLMQNQTACISDNQFLEIIDTYKDKRELNILDLMIKRKKLPLSIIEKLEELTSKSIRSYASQEQHSTQTPNDSLLSNDNPNTPKSYAEKIPLLSQKGALTHSLMLRSLCEGNLSFFEESLAFLLNEKEPLALMEAWDAKKIAHITELCKSAKLSSQLTDAVIIALRYYQQSLQTYTENANLFTGQLLNFLEAHPIRGSDLLVTYLKLIKRTDKRIDDTIRQHLNV